PAAHALGAFSHQRQAYPRTGIDLSIMQTLKQAENFLMMGLGNANSVIFHPEPNETAAFSGGNTEDRSPLRCDKFEPVADEVGNDLLERRQVGISLPQRRDQMDLCASIANLL